MRKEDIDLFMSLGDDLDKSYPTMHRYVKENNYPAEVCLAVERLSGGKLTAVKLRPDLFKPSPAQIALCEQCVKQFPNQLESGQLQLTIAILNFFESQQPDLYEDMMLQIAQLDGGETFVKQRMAHKQNEYN